MSDALHKREMSARLAELMGCSRPGGELAHNAVFQSITDASRDRDMVVRPARGVIRRECNEMPVHNAVPFRAGETLRQVARE